MNPQVLVPKAEIIINTYKRTQAPTFPPVGNQQRLVQRTWSPPMRGYFKLNVDATPIQKNKSQDWELSLEMELEMCL